MYLQCYQQISCKINIIFRHGQIMAHSVGIIRLLLWLHTHRNPWAHGVKPGLCHVNFCFCVIAVNAILSVHPV